MDLRRRAVAVVGQRIRVADAARREQPAIDSFRRDLLPECDRNEREMVAALRAYCVMPSANNAWQLTEAMKAHDGLTRLYIGGLDALSAAIESGRRKLVEEERRAADGDAEAQQRVDERRVRGAASVRLLVKVGRDLRARRTKGRVMRRRRASGAKPARRRGSRRGACRAGPSADSSGEAGPPPAACSARRRRWSA